MTRNDDQGEGEVTKDDGAADEDVVPLSELRDDVEGRKAAGGTGEEFLQESVGSVESEAVWADLLMGEGDTDGLIPPSDLDGEFQIVTKTLCHRCEFFGDPPDLHCTHDGTTIHETVDMEHYRVSSCPMVTTERE